MLRLTKLFFCTHQRKVFHRILNGDILTTKEITIDRSPCVYDLSPNRIHSNLDEIYSKDYDVIIVGAGHNGLVCANYLAEKGKKVLVLEKRHEVGGAAITEELVQGYKLSRCSYVLSLFRRKIIDELFGKNFFEEIKLFKRDPHSFTPTLDGNYLLLGSSRSSNEKEIAKFSKKDAKNFPEYEEFLTKMVGLIKPIIDTEPISKFSLFNKNNIYILKHLFQQRNNIIPFYHFLTSSASLYLDRYFENEVLKATFATDAVIGAMKSPSSVGSAYVLLHHVMGDIDENGSWFYVQGGTGTVSKYLAKKAINKGVKIMVNSPVEQFTFDDNRLCGVRVNGKEIKSKIVVANCDPYNTYFKLLTDLQRSRYLDKETASKLERIDYKSPVCKINLIVNKLPMFKCLENLHQNDPIKNENIALNYLTGTIHMNSESMDQIEVAYNEAMTGIPSKHPIIEMTIPSVLDKSLVPESSGHHVIGLFTQYAPTNLKNGQWDDKTKREYVQSIYRDIDKYCEGFSSSILFEDILCPKDLEDEFSLTGGSIFHGALDINSLYFCRPVVGSSSYESKINNLFSCSSGMHPGGGIMGAVGRNCAIEILKKV